MAQGILTPLQLTAASALLANTGINPLPTALTTAVASFNAGSPIPNFLTAVANYTAASFANATTLTSLLTIGNTTIPALGDSIPAAFTNLTPVSTVPAGFAGLIQQTGNNYLGNGDVGRFAQGFMAVQGYINSTNQFINSATNAQTYLGPTFTNMDALTTNSVSDVNPDFGNFAVDLINQGNLTQYGRWSIWACSNTIIGRRINSQRNTNFVNRIRHSFRKRISSFATFGLPRYDQCYRNRSTTGVKHIGSYHT